MSSSEIAFLALGLVLGGALGAAFLAAVRTRPAPRREVRITIAPNSIRARRSVTLADPTAARTRPSPPGSPDYAAWPDRPVDDPPSRVAADLPSPGTALPLRTRVPSVPTQATVSAVAVPVSAGHPATGLEGIASRAGRSPGYDVVSASLARPTVGIAVADRPANTSTAVLLADPAVPAATAVLDERRPSPERLVRPRPPVPDPRFFLASTAVGIPIARAGEPLGTSAPGSGVTWPSEGLPSGSVDPCEAVRTLAGERCAEAEVARDLARTAQDARREAQRTVDALRERIDRDQAVSDPRRIAATKAELHASFRVANAKAATPEEAEAAARRWLTAIDRVNTDARTALRAAELGATELREQLPRLERLVLEADAARITAESADQTCRTAREDLARCEEATAAAAPLPAAGMPHPFAAVWPTEADLSPNHEPAGVPTENLAGLPAIVGMLRRDRDARDRVVTALAGDEPALVAVWQLRLSALLDAIAGRAIEAGCLNLPDDHPFWALFLAVERREIVRALSSLGFRFDGLGGFADGRTPSARDLSLAVGYSGLDPMRIRIWPREAELAALYADATVAADEWLAGEADDLSLGAVVDALGPRAADLGELWDAWGRVRPLLLAAD